MAIQTIGQHGYKTSPQSSILSGQTAASISLFLKYEGNPGNAGFTYLTAYDNFAVGYIMLPGSGVSGTIRVSFSFAIGGVQYSTFLDLPINIVHHVALTHGPGAQTAWANGAGTRFATQTGAIQSSSNGFGIGLWDFSPSLNNKYTQGDINIWNGYTLTASDVAALRDGVDPTTIGTGASRRFRWTLAGTAGQVPVAGAGGLAESYGQPATTYNLSNTVTGISGSSSIYTDPLVWTPSVRVREARVSTSGKNVFFFTETINSSSKTLPLTAPTAPTVTINGTNLGQLINKLCSGTDEYIHYTMPTGVVALPSDVITFDAPNGWATAQAGVVAAMVGKAANNRVGRSSMGTESLAKTLRPGTVVEWFPYSSEALTAFPKNRVKEMGGFDSVATRDSNNKPLTTSAVFCSAQLHLYNPASLGNGLDSLGYPGETGLIAIGWDDLNTSVPTTFGLFTNTPATTTIVELTQYNNPGVNGIGKVRVFQVSRAAGSPNASTDIVVSMTNSNKTPQFDNLTINGEGDFTPVLTTNGGTVLDKSDPFALSWRFLDRIRNFGSLRCWNYLIGGSASNMAEPEDMRKADDFSWGFTSYTKYNQFGWTKAEPYSQADTPWVYSPTAGSKYNATLAVDINASATVLQISDAATAPVMFGSRLFIDDEVMRVTNVSGTNVTVVRGAQNTTPASHTGSPRTIQVGYRIPSPTLTQMASFGHMVKLTSAVPHKLMTAMSSQFFGSGYPTFTYTNGFSENPAFSSIIFMVAGPNTVIYHGGFGNETPVGTLTGTVNLNPANNYSLVTSGDSPLVPYSQWGATGSRANVPNMLVALPACATDDFIWQAAREIRDNSVPGACTWWIEMSNECWNGFYGGNWWTFTYSSLLYPSQTGYAYEVRRTDEAKAIFKAAFNEGGRGRGGEIKVFLNVQNTGPNAAYLNWAASQTPPILIDAILDAPYVDPGYTSNGTAAMLNSGALDPEQCADLFIHALTYCATSSSMKSWSTSWKGLIDTYNATVPGAACKYGSYEGGVQTISNNIPRDRDTIYSWVWYYAEQDFIALAQQVGYEIFNFFCLSDVWEQNRLLFGIYHGRNQDHGIGDGRDGKADNRLCLAQTKPSTICQDTQNVSVRGQAILDWNQAATASISISVFPSRLGTNTNTRVTIAGSGTSWTTQPPQFSASGAPTADPGWSAGPAAVFSDESAMFVLITGNVAGTVTWTDASIGKSVNQTIFTSIIGAPVRANYRDHL